MGRGGFRVLKDRPNTLHLFVHAPRSFRIERITKAHGIARPREARSRVDESDRTRTKFIRDIVGAVWTDARNYHLCIDSSFVGLSESVRMVVGLAKRIQAETRRK